MSNSRHKEQSILESAVMTPQASFGGEYLHADLFEMAAALCVSHRGESAVSGWKQEDGFSLRFGLS